MVIISNLDHHLLKTLKQQHGENLDGFIFPPPVFEIMQGEFLSYDLEQTILIVRFPVLENWLNPYGIMQGGMLAAAIDNTIGPLSRAGCFCECHPPNGFEI